MNQTQNIESLYDTLQVIRSFNETTRLCISLPTNKLYVAKKMPGEAYPLMDAIKRISSPCLTPIREIVFLRGCIDVVSDYEAGETLSSLLDRVGTLPEETVRMIALDVCTGLEALHGAGIVHRDVTPNNVIITPLGRAKIIDYGITRSYTEQKSSDTVIMGTPGYAAPEQFGFKQSDARTDIYAVGVMINVMLTGELPGETRAEGRMGRIVEICTEMDAFNRYDSITTLRNALTHPGNENRRTPGFRGILGQPCRLPSISSPSTVRGIVIVEIILTGMLMLSAGGFAGIFAGLTLTFFFWIPFAILVNLGGFADRMSRMILKQKERTVGGTLKLLLLSLLTLFACTFLLLTIESAVERVTGDPEAAKDTLEGTAKAAMRTVIRVFRR